MSLNVPNAPLIRLNNGAKTIFSSSLTDSRKSLLEMARNRIDPHSVFRGDALPENIRDAEEEQ